MEEIIELWKSLNIDKINFGFNCGGDDMGDTDLTILDANGETIENSEIEGYFEYEVYNNVEFYVNSDGHYQGESGTVVIELEDNNFIYAKQSESEWSESIVSKAILELTDAETDFINNHVVNINGGSDTTPTFVYKEDFILENEELEEILSQKIVEFTEEFEPDNLQGELEEWFTFSTDESMENEGLKLVGNELTIHMFNQETVYKDE